MEVSVVIPAYNEEASIREVVLRVREVLNRQAIHHEVVVVVDGSTDQTESVAKEVADRVVVHPTNCGYGRSLKSGILAARHDRIVITDADSTYPCEAIAQLLKLADSFDMVVGARSGKFYSGSTVKRIGRMIFRWLGEYATGQKIPDINSGLRVFRRCQIIPFFPLINSGFSFTTTTTLAYLLNNMLVTYVPIEYHKRSGNSKVHHVRDSLRALQIIFEAILRCNPIKAFLLLVIPFAGLAGLLLILAVLTWNPVWLGWALMAASVAAVLLAIGFLAVSLSPHRLVRTAGSLVEGTSTKPQASGPSDPTEAIERASHRHE